MSTTLSKRQQARNEKQLQELVHDVPGNNLCADCHARNPAWASWSLGVFLCMRCAAIHRKLGTHISKVKSLSMDSWSNEQVDNMRKVGNVASNQIYNSENRRPPVPIDADEADSAMERFVRQKYMNNVVSSNRGKPNSPRSDEGVPPPLPPKNSKFGFRSASSLFPLSRSKKDAKAAAAAYESARHHGHRDVSKPAQVFGASADFDSGDGVREERKLAHLRDMGFHDNQRNVIVLKGVNGNLERAIESLVRLGEGEATSPAPAPLPKEPMLRATKSMTPLNNNSGGQPLGLSLTPKQPVTPSSASTNPFDMMGPAQPQTAQSTGSLQNNNPYTQNQTTNPFGVPQAPQQLDAFSQAFHQLDIASAQQQQQQQLQQQQQQQYHQPLFPHHTGGLTPQGQEQAMFSQYIAPSAPTSPQVYQQMGFQNMTYSQPQPLQQQQTAYNPFYANQQGNQVQPQPHQNLTLNTQQPWANNPFARSPTRVASPAALGQIPEQSQTSFQSPMPLQQQMTGTNPFFNAAQQAPSPVGYQQSPQQPQLPYGQQNYYQAQRQDNASIMALYSMSPVTTPQTGAPAVLQNSHFSSIPEDQTLQISAPAPMTTQPQRSMTAPVMQSASNNPFMQNTAQAGQIDPFTTQRHISRESVNLGKDMAWNNGRHSPDAFASLSARHA